ncbi:phosphatase PAP2 family protein [Mesorhizobium xinjiangense]|uniref:phosphatase PAP2 family protein n=1 Tax=Mesorhizobium xinjiangense TaxID=2678685 RepID=UPI0018DC4FCD|nr:phosphatase PAP2 family protein [Mesorhizobium xinjiangense]
MSVAALIAVLLVLTALPFDAPLARWAVAADGYFVQLLRAVTDAALVQWYLVPAMLVVILLSLMDWRKHAPADRIMMARLFAHSLFVIASIGGAQLCVRVVKIVFGRPRPPLIADAGPFGFDAPAFHDAYWSFPSGHATTAGALTMLFAIYFRPLRLPALAAGVLLAVSRVAANDHYLSDVVAGYSIGLVFTLWLARLLARHHIAFRLPSAGQIPVPAGPPARARSGDGA